MAIANLGGPVYSVDIEFLLNFFSGICIYWYAEIV